MSLINVSNLTFAYEGSYDNIFENVSFRMDTDWKLGFTGRNGRGKTTFLQLLMGKYAYHGSITAAVQFEYFPYAVDDKEISTKSVINKICEAYQDWELLRELSLLEIPEEKLEQSYHTLSGGEQTKILLAALFLKENNFLLIDEPTNHLDTHGRKILSKYLAGKQSFILVSHDRAFLDGCIDHVLSINKTNIEVQKGNFSSWWENKTRQDEFELAENAKLKKEIKRLEKTAREKAQWSDKIEATKIGGGPTDRGAIGARAAKMMKKSKAIEKRQTRSLEDKSQLLKNLDNADALKITQLPYHSHRILSLRDVSLFYGEKPVCQHINLTIEQGDRIALSGRNGSGKSTLLKLITGEPLTYTGELEKNNQLRISYVSQDTTGLKGTLTHYANHYNLNESLFKAILRKLDFSRIQLEKDIRDFSGGQKKKTLLAKSLCEKAHLLIWDEPLNFIDVLSRIQIEDLLLTYKPTILFVEHDRIFCDKVATRKESL